MPLERNHRWNWRSLDASHGDPGQRTKELPGSVPASFFLGASSASRRPGPASPCRTEDAFAAACVSITDPDRGAVRACVRERGHVTTSIPTPAVRKKCNIKEKPTRLVRLRSYREQPRQISRGLRRELQGPGEPGSIYYQLRVSVAKTA